MELKETLLKLSTAAGIGTVSAAADIAADILGQFCAVERHGALGVTGEFKGESDKTLLLDAHIDEVGFIVTDVSGDGFLTVAQCGSVDLRHLPAKRVTVHGKKDISGVFCSVPPHLSRGNAVPDNIADIKIDTGLGCAAAEQISVGDYVTYCEDATEMIGSKICGKSLDNRAGVSCLLMLAQKLSGKKLPLNVVILFSDAEELGLRGAKTATFRINPDEAVVIDVSFGNGPDVPQHSSGKISGGGMIGISPVLDNGISKKLTEIAKQKNIDYQTEVMGGRTSTNADVISLSGGGVKTGLVSIPLRNMHTNAEVVDLGDITAVCNLLYEYIMSRGSGNV